MPLTLNCPKCHKPFRVRDESVGMRVKCPTCAAVLQVPANLSSESSEGSKVDAPPPAPAGRRQETAAPAKANIGGRDESFLEALPEPRAHSGPPSLTLHAASPPARHRREEPLDLEPEPERPQRSRGVETVSRKPANQARIQPKDEQIDPQQIVEDAEGWRRVRKGLFWVQVAFFLALLPAIGNFAIIAYAANAESKAPEELKDKGFLGKGMTLWQEIEYGYLFAIPVLVYLFLLRGRASQMRVPESARTRGTASGLFLLTLISFAAFATYACSVLLPRFADISLPREVNSIAWTTFIYFGLLTEAWYFIYLGQLGAPLHSTRTLRDTALSLLMLVVLIAGVQIANGFYALRPNSPKLKTDEILNTRMIEAGVFLVIAFVFVFRVTAVTGIIRRAISRWMEDNKSTLQAVTD